MYLFVYLFTILYVFIIQVNTVTAYPFLHLILEKMLIGSQIIVTPGYTEWPMPDPQWMTVIFKTDNRYNPGTVL